MSNQKEQSNISDLESAASEDTGFEMRWNTDDLPEGMKRRKTHHHRHHRHSSGHARFHSSHHHSSRSHQSSTNRDSSRPEFEDLLFRTDPSDSAAGKKESEHEEITTGASQPTAIKTGKTGNEKKEVKPKSSFKKNEENDNRRASVTNSIKNELRASKENDVAMKNLSNTEGKQKKDKKSKSAGKKIGIVALCLVLALLVGGFGFLNGFLNKIGRENSNDLPKADPDKTYEDIDKSDLFGVGDLNLEPIRQDKVKNILLIGQDRRKGDGARMRSDSMIVATIDLTTNEIKLTSLMRDMYVPVPGYGYGMINATYLHGGMALLDETIERNFGITIDGNVEVDFTRFISLMELIGPLDIELKQEEAEFLNRENGWHLKAGNNSMNSEQVLAYCRVRRVGRSDWERTDRQRSVVTKMFNKLRQSDLSTLYRFANEAFPLLKTDLSNSEILRYVYTVISKGMHITESKRLPKDGTYTQEIREETLQVLVPDLRTNANLLQEYVYGYSDIQVKKNNEAVAKSESSKNNKKKSTSLVIEE